MSVVKNILIWITSILAFSSIIAQDKQILCKYRPTAFEFYNILDQGVKSNEIKFIKLLYNEEGNYYYTNEKSFDGEGKTLVFQFYSKTPKVKFTIEGLTINNFEKVIFNVFNISEVTIKGCNFINIMRGVIFEFKEFTNNKNNESNITIEKCNFIDTELYKGKSKTSSQIQFNRNKYSKDISILKNIKIHNCVFKMKDNKKSWLIKSANNTYPKRHSIIFYRVDSNTAFSNISILDNRFEGYAPYYRTEAITFVNNHDADFQSSKELYNYNRNIKVINNKMKTNSDDPGHGIFIQGPYKSVVLDRNIIENYGMNMYGGDRLNCDGAIDIYGARNKKYSDDLIDVSLTNNNVSSRSIGMKILGIQNIVVSGNMIKMSSWPNFYKKTNLINKTDRVGIRVATGAYKNSSKKSHNIIIKNNVINCNYEKACAGINVQGVKNFKIFDNRINNSTSYGIFVFGHKAESDLSLGQSSIVDNTIDYGKQNINSLSTNFYKSYDVSFSAIKIHRMANGKRYKNETLLINGNKIVDKSNTIPKASIVDLTNSQLIKNTKSDILLEK